MKATVFLHKIGGAEAIGSLWPVLQEKFTACSFVDAFDDALDGGFDPYAPDLLVVMNGSPGVYQKDIYPFLKQEIAILEKRLARDLPTFGLCLGSQLMAAALGSSRNYKGPQGPEYGWYDISVNDAGMKTPLVHLDKSKTKMMQLHQDTFDLPAGAVLLASSALYENQAYSWGKNAMGVQFHPEMTPRLIKNWMVGSGEDVAAGGRTMDEMYRQTAQYGDTLMRQARLFFSAWIDQVLPGGKSIHA